jgi:hypothetical protein
MILKIMKLFIIKNYNKELNNLPNTTEYFELNNYNLKLKILNVMKYYD